MPAGTLLNTTLTYCTPCAQTELAYYMERPDGVYLESHCPASGQRQTRIAADPDWFRARMTKPRPVRCHGAQPVARGCPLDCGLCEFHTGGLRLPVLSITNACNLDCPICFTYNRPDQTYFKSPQDMARIVSHILAETERVDLINITGGEPTLHPQLFDLLEQCRRDEIGRITLNSNGVRLANSLAFAQQLKAAGVQIVLSVDTFDEQKSRIIHGIDLAGIKKRALARLEALEIPTTILSVCIKNVNETDVAEIVNSYFQRPFVRSITIQNMTFTGQNGSRFSNSPDGRSREHITMDEVERLLAQNGPFAQQDFFPLGNYHPLCYSVAYYIVHEDRLLSLSQLIDRSRLAKAFAGGYLLNPGRELSRDFLDGVNRLWAEGEDPRFVKLLRDFFDELYPADRHLTVGERARIAEKLIKPIYIHPHMDADNFDIGRVSACGDIVPDESGRMIPACAYNLVHRQQDERFWVPLPT
jgi:7,8-dihydro-6-hydroxymethylpterin dimethyltransferase